MNFQDLLAFIQQNGGKTPSPVPAQPQLSSPLIGRYDNLKGQDLRSLIRGVTGQDKPETPSPEMQSLLDGMGQYMSKNPSPAPDMSQIGRPTMNSGVENLLAGSQAPRIPRANKNGLTRLSPGVYRDQKGKLVNKMRG